MARHDDNDERYEQSGKGTIWIIVVVVLLIALLTTLLA